MLLDADALTLFESRVPSLARLIGQRAALITPHPAEFASALGPECGRRARVALRRGTRSSLGRLGAAVLLKGTPTVVSSIDGRRSGERGGNRGARDRRKRRRAEWNRRNDARATRRSVRRGRGRGVDSRTRRRAHPLPRPARRYAASHSTTSLPSCATAGASIVDRRRYPVLAELADRRRRLHERQLVTRTRRRIRCDSSNAERRGARARAESATMRRSYSVPRGEALVASVDSAIENRHFKPSWLSPREIGYRAVAAALSDLAAMAARPLGVLVAIAVPARVARSARRHRRRHRRRRRLGGDARPRRQPERRQRAVDHDDGTRLGVHAAHPRRRASRRSRVRHGPARRTRQLRSVACLAGESPGPFRDRFAHPVPRLARSEMARRTGRLVGHRHLRRTGRRSSTRGAREWRVHRDRRPRRSVFPRSPPGGGGGERRGVRAGRHGAGASTSTRSPVASMFR